MKRFILLLFLTSFCQASFSQTAGLDYFLPVNFQANPSVPKPADVIGFEVGEWHVSHDRLLQYMKALAAARPDRIKLQSLGKTVENREQVVLIFTSPANHARLEQIRSEHVRLANGAVSGNVQTANMPAVLLMGYSIHGNESSGSNAALLAAYYLAAGETEEIKNQLENTVILLDPSFNPDGLTRFSTWANQHRSLNLVTDPQSREYSEVWPGGRFSHYWFDLNRDWLPASHSESRNRLKLFHEWKPNVLTDHHEMGSNSTFFFQPGVPDRVNPLTPAINQQLTAEIGKFHAQILDSIGSLYFSREAFDDFYYGKGSTYPDIQGSIGILFEQASSRGHAQETENGLLTFPFTIRNQFVTTISTIRAVNALRPQLLNYQRNYFSQIYKDGTKVNPGGYVFGNESDAEKGWILAEMLQRHTVQVYELDATINAGGNQFKPGSAYYVPMNQPQQTLLRSVFEKQHSFKDSLFYDITTWTMPLAFGLNYAPVNPSAIKTGDLFNPSVAASGAQISKAGYSYVIDWRNLKAPGIVYALLAKNIRCLVANNHFSSRVNNNIVQFGRGSVIVPVNNQPVSPDSLQKLIQKLSTDFAVHVHSINSGAAVSGSDIGSGNNQNLKLPKIAMLVGEGVSPTDAGPVWYFMDNVLKIPITHLDVNSVGRADLSKYSIIIMAAGRYNTLNKSAIKEYVQGGGNLLVMEEAISFAKDAGIGNVELRTEESDTASYINFADRTNYNRGKQIYGSIFRASIDTTHPIGYGYTRNYIDLFKQNNLFVKIPKQRNQAVSVYESNSLQSGYVPANALANIKNSAAIIIQPHGRGKLIAITENPVFRGYWYEGLRLLANSIFFGSQM